MREILFRGKRKDNGEWVVGSLVKMGPVGYAHHFILPDYASAFYDIEVDPATIGQYSDLTDKNGVKIFEGDILRVNEPEFIPVSGVVRFGEYDLNVGFFVEWLNDRIFYRHDLRYWVERPYCVARGNIHDNPELLK